MDMGCFASAKHLASWAGLCPGNHQSAGKRKRGTTTKGNVWLRGILGDVAWAAIRTKGTCFGAQFKRVARRQGTPKALVAVAHRLLGVIYVMLRDQQPYRELGPDYVPPQHTRWQTQHLVQRLEHLGYTVTLTPRRMRREHDPQDPIFGETRCFHVLTGAACQVSAVRVPVSVRVRNGRCLPAAAQAAEWR